MGEPLHADFQSADHPWPERNPDELAVYRVGLTFVTKLGELVLAKRTGPDDQVARFVLVAVDNDQRHCVRRDFLDQGRHIGR